MRSTMLSDTVNVYRSIISIRTEKTGFCRIEQDLRCHQFNCHIMSHEYKTVISCRSTDRTKESASGRKC